MYTLLISLIFSALTIFANNEDAQRLEKQIDGYTDKLFPFYQEMHANPELSFQEFKTSEKVAKELKSLGYEVTEKVGRTGVVGVLKNGKGPTLLIRADMDALPVEEKTGLAFASKVKATNSAGEKVPVMHACGHDLHTTIFLGTARLMAQERDSWAGTLVMMAQPAEELGAGALAMINDGLLKKHKPQMAIALHVSSAFKAGVVASKPDYAMANVDSLVLEVKGVGGHGAYPHKTKDPIVLASQIVLALQTLVSRENTPTDPAVVTVGSFQAGTKSNVIPDSALLKLTVRSYKDEVRDRLLKGIARIAKGQAQAAGVPEERMPVITEEDVYTPAVYNDPELIKKINKSFARVLPAEQIVTADALMGGEDFGQLGRQSPKIPIAIYWLGAVPAKMFDDYKKKDLTLPSLHSSGFVPDWQTTIKVGVKTMSAAALDLLKPAQ